MARDKTLDVKMEQIAHFVADKILDGASVDNETNTAFKTLTAYWTAATKLDKVGQDEETAKSGFGGIKTRLESVK